MAGAEAALPGLATQHAVTLLEERYALEVERAKEDIARTEARLRASLRELDLARREGERRLGARSAQLRGEYEAALAALERRFLTDAEALQARLREGLQREAALCQAGIDAKAQELLQGLGSPGSASWPASPARGGGSPAPSLGASPARLRSPSAAQPAPPPAVAAATEAIQALRQRLPPSPRKLQAAAASPPAKPGASSGGPAHAVIRLNATSSFAHPAPSASPVRAAPAPPPARPPAYGVRFAAAALRGGDDAEPASAAAAAPQAASSRVAAASGAPPAPPAGLAHESSSEWEDDSYLLGEESSAEATGASLCHRAPSVKIVNPAGASPRAGVPRAPTFGVARPGGSGGKAPHLNLLQPDAPGSPTLRANSPCTHGAGAAASPRAGARSPACCGVLRSAGHVSYSSD